MVGRGTLSEKGCDSLPLESVLKKLLHRSTNTDGYVLIKQKRSQHLKLLVMLVLIAISCDAQAIQIICLVTYD